MAQRQHHYERAFESYLRTQRLPYVAVNEAKRALLPKDAQLTITQNNSTSSIKNFDFVVYAQDTDTTTPIGTRPANLLVEIKGRRLPRLRLKDGSPAKARLESWVTLDDVNALSHWQELFGDAYIPVFVFVYWCDDVPPDGLFTEVFEYQSRWYTLRAVTLSDYKAHMTTRSPKWRTVNLPTADFERLYRNFAPPIPDPPLIHAPHRCSVHA